MNTLNSENTDDLIRNLSQFVSEHKMQRIEEVLQNRTRYLSVVLENVYQPHNASAVIRSCECFGIQNLHIIEKDNSFRPNSHVVQGAVEWLTLKRYSCRNQDNLKQCIQSLKDQGFKIAAMTLRKGSMPVYELDVSQKTALCFGNELHGLSDELHDLSDVHVHIPMTGFTQSLNLSVSVSLCLYELTKRLKESDLDWRLTDDEKQNLKLEWCKKSLYKGDVLLKAFLNQKA